MVKLRYMVVGAIAAVLAVALVVTANAQETGKVTVIHGVPGLTVDVYVNGELTLEDFAPDTVTNELELPAGDYDLEVYPAGADPTAGDPAISGATTLPAGANASIIAHLTADGTPTLSVYVNDVSDIEAGSARLTVRHTAAAPAVDVWANGDVLFSNLANPDEVSGIVPGDKYSVAVSATGATDPVLGPLDLTLDAGTAYFVYAVGSLADGSLDVLVQTADVTESHAGDLPPAGVGPTGGSSNWAVIWMALGLGALGIALVGSAAAVAARVRAR